MAIDTDTTWRRDVSVLHGHEGITTTAALAKIAQDANGGEPAPVVHAGDKTYDELVTEYKGPGANKAGIAESTLSALHVAADAWELAAGGAAGAIAGPVAGLAVGLYELAEANARGRELHTALRRDEQRVALLSNLALPQGYVQKELARFSHNGTTFQAQSQQLGSWMHGNDHALAALLQLHCDQGMNSAHDMCDAGVDRSRFFATHPDVAQRYQTDIAFKNGFDALEWAHDQGGATYAGAVNDLQARDARYGAAGVAVRG